VEQVGAEVTGERKSRRDRSGSRRGRLRSIQMISPPRRTSRLFSRRLILLSSPAVANRQRRACVEIRFREFLTLGHFMAYDEPTNFELSVSNLIEEPWEVHGSVNQ
jgi:hypothetical protein